MSMVKFCPRALNFGYDFFYSYIFLGQPVYNPIIMNKYKNHLTPIKLPLFIIFITDLKSIWCLLSMRELLGWGPVSADRHQLRHLAAKVKTKGWQGWKHVIKSLVPPCFQIILILIQYLRKSMFDWITRPKVYRCDRGQPRR